MFMQHLGFFFHPYFFSPPFFFPIVAFLVNHKNIKGRVSATSQKLCFLSCCHQKAFSFFVFFFFSLADACCLVLFLCTALIILLLHLG